MSPHRRKALDIARVGGWALALALLAGLGAGAWRLKSHLDHQDRDRIANTARFVELVRACRRTAPKPMPSWQACEERVRAAESDSDAR